MIHFQYSVTICACKNVAWDVFSNWKRWNQFANIYGQLRWREGAPWEPGSCMEIEVLRPVNTVVNHVITQCVPAQKVGWIDHAMGVVIGQWVTFERQNGDGTRIHTWGEIVRPSLKIADAPSNSSSPASPKPGTKIFAWPATNSPIPTRASPKPANKFSETLPSRGTTANRRNASHTL